MYRIIARGYLARAKSLLRRQTKAKLFYAAYELRCCIEARQDEYLKAQKEYVKSIPPRWKIGAQGKALKSIGRSESMQRLAFKSGERTYILVYIPVTETLRNSGEQLGELLHSQDLFRDDKDPCWSDLEERLYHISQQAEYCCNGDLLCPALIVHGSPAGKIVIAGSSQHAFIMEPIAETGQVQLTVSNVEKWDVRTPPIFYPWL